MAKSIYHQRSVILTLGSYFMHIYFITAVSVQQHMLLIKVLEGNFQAKHYTSLILSLHFFEGNTRVSVEGKQQTSTSAETSVPVSTIVPPTEINIMDTKTPSNTKVDVSHLLVRVDRIVRNAYSVQSAIIDPNILGTLFGITVAKIQLYFQRLCVQTLSE